MKRSYEIIGFILLMICSVIYDFVRPETLQQNITQASSYVILEGAFLIEGKYEYHDQMTIKQLIEEVGVRDDANLEALKLDKELIDESTIYLPKKNDKAVSLNHASKEELMTLERIGEKTAQKIIDYRNEQLFHSIEDIMNISGIGEKTYLRIRDYLCL